MSQAPRRTKIIATLGPATDRPACSRRSCARAWTSARINFSHGGADDHRRRAHEVRAAAKKLGREVGLLADLRGPKIRINQFVGGRIELEPGQHFTLDCHYDAAPGDRTGSAWPTSTCATT